MSEESAKPVNVDPRCIQEALRMYLQPIKNDDPQLDFYTMYKRETMEYDTEYMQKYNEDLNTTLIFAGLFSAVSSAFVIDVQPKLEPDPTGRSEAYLRAILLSLNGSIFPDEEPSIPPAWGGPPQEIITTLDLLYASLLMSLLAAFVAMLGKQWLNRYLRHAGGSVVERCGDRQRKFEGLKKWPFRLFIESLPIMLQIALLLLTCGLSRHMWSVNTSVACVVISFAVLGIVFYIGIVVAGTSSYQCPFQTPASIALRRLRDSGTTRKLLASLSPLGIISLIYVAFGISQQGLVFAYHYIHNTTRHLFSLEISPSRIVSGIHDEIREVGQQTVVFLLQINRAFRNAKRGVVRGIRRFGRRGLLPTTTEDASQQSLTPQNISRLRVRVWNVEALRKQNTDHARCVSWVLWNITDPEAIDSAIRLAGTIRWFDGDSDSDPPFDLIVSTFEACFDSAKQLYPGMRDRAYFSARAILQINTGARAQSNERASQYPLPAICLSSFQRTDPDLHHILHVLERNVGSHRPTLDFPRGGTNTHAHSLWLSNLFVDLTLTGPNPILESYRSYLTVAVTNHRGVIANILLIWYMFLGGQIEEEIIWAVDKTDLLEVILSHLSKRVVEVTSDGYFPHDLRYLLEFLAAWEKRPACLTPLAYHWCSAISEAAARPGPSDVHTDQQFWRLFRLQPQDLVAGKFADLLPLIAEEGFREVGPGFDLFPSDGASRHARGRPLDLTPDYYAHLLSMTLEVGFRLAGPGCDQPTFRSNHASHHEWIFETAFSSDDDEVIADAVCVWIIDGGCMPPGSFVRCFARRVERDTPFSPRLRRVGIAAIERIWRSELEVLGLETVRLLNRLGIHMDDIAEQHKWARVLVDVIRSPAGLKSLSFHYWHLLGRLALTTRIRWDFSLRNVEVMRLLEGAGDWDKLEVWMVVVWLSVPELFGGAPRASVEDIERVTLKLFSLRPSVLPRFVGLCQMDPHYQTDAIKLQRICEKAQVERLPSELPPPLQSICAQPPVPLSLVGDDTF